MFDTNSDRGKLIVAALELAAEKPWSDVSLREIAERAGLKMDALRGSFGSKTQIIAAYMKAVDNKVLASREPDDEQSPRDALFETIMARLDVMAEHKDALRSINDDVSPDSTLFNSYLNSQRWMLLASGIDGDGPRGVIRSVGLASLFGSIFRTWLNDEDPGQAKTMAALDRRLRRAEQTMSTIDQTLEGVDRLKKTILGGVRRGASRMRPGRAGSTTPAPDPDIGPAAPTGDL
ncbi:MAG: helix-turn-helix domain-containing protein [Pseudomonadota bacterium]